MGTMRVTIRVAETMAVRVTSRIAYDLSWIPKRIFFIFGLLFPTDPLGLCQNGLKFKVCEWVSGFKGS